MGFYQHFKDLIGQEYTRRQLISQQAAETKAQQLLNPPTVELAVSDNKEEVVVSDNEQQRSTELVVSDNEQQRLLRLVVNVDEQRSTELVVNVSGQERVISTIKTYEDIQRVAQTAIQWIVKPQQLLSLPEEEDYYIAVDMYTNTYYMCMRNVLMLDIDYNKNGDQEHIAKWVLDYCREHPDALFHLYETRNGLHLFLVSREMDFRSREAVELMLSAGCDPYYVVFAYLRGWSVRLNRKVKDNKDYIYTPLCTIGDGKPIPKLQALVDVHYRLSQDLLSVKPSTQA